MAENINTVAEARKVEEEFRLCKSYEMHKPTDTKLISSEELTEFFQDHLKENPVELQPEVITPELYPHILPPDDININTSIPSEEEIDDARKRFKNGKCQGTDKIYAEELKYNSSECMFLISIVWTT